MERISSFFLMAWSLVFVLKLIPHLLVKIKNYFPCTCWRRLFCFFVHSPWEKNLKSFPFKMVLSWKQCSCDVIIARVYWNSCIHNLRSNQDTRSSGRNRTRDAAGCDKMNLKDVFCTSRGWTWTYNIFIVPWNLRIELKFLSQ